MGVVSNLIFLVRITKLDKLLYESVKATILRQEKIPLASFEKNMPSFTIQMRIFSPSGFL
ncbi:Uncharacterised protein [Salmonella enterica subsp. enterica]|uniref:Uncharacterized protein n=1 Tax=Salmonella enterica I TaxID=59201 RepID=A0A3S4LT26_SALET|nr:Uncharacterised protein [Salmonella enterica subsp. enterica]